MTACCARLLGLHIGYMAQARDEEEWRKRITASLMKAAEAIVISNINIPLESGVLAAALTGPYWEDRVLGKNLMVRISVRNVWTTTGNNPVVSTEVARRSIRVRLDPKCERSWERKDFKHDELRSWADENREDLVWEESVNNDQISENGI